MFLQLLLLFVMFVPVWLPVVFAVLSRATPKPIRWVLGGAGGVAALYAAFIYLRVGNAPGHGGMLGSLLIPFAAAVLSFYVAFTGVCVLTVASYVPTGRVRSPGGVFAIILVIGCLVSGVVLLWPFLRSPLE